MRKEELFRKMKCKGKKIFAMSIAAAVFMSALTTGYSCDKVNVSAAKKKISTVKIGKAVVTTANGKVAVPKRHIYIQGKFWLLQNYYEQETAECDCPFEWGYNE